MRGKFIVIEGTDGSGKGTQTALLAQRIKKSGHDIETIAFPRHGELSAKLVDLYLNGFFGDATKVDPRFVSSFYAIDRLLNKERIEDWLNYGRVVIGDRYTTSNIGHQGAKVDDPEERERLFNWVYKMEFEEMGLPQPDLMLFLHIPTPIAMQLIEKKKQREYIKSSNKDAHEGSESHLRGAETSYLHAAKLFKWEVIECVKDDKLLSIEEVNDKIWDKVSQILPFKKQSKIKM
ncbi:MAG: thymidylate kinase [Patescibacteria group bacterium]|nr:thymidylate kinase [Patescibacteria group bacterium]MDD5121742.1 thymidylate kinase [Patescibacteria group bacterium]MDD5222283.1 thymidylate kinase [Patescibacteria group bacterium]MDD5396406.1 thymidylate kinase [Patescibacteria group bacterium]